MKRGFRNIAALTAAIQILFSVMPAAAFAENHILNEGEALVREIEASEEIGNPNDEIKPEEEEKQTELAEAKAEESNGEVEVEKSAEKAEEDNKREALDEKEAETAREEKAEETEKEAKEAEREKEGAEKEIKEAEKTKEEKNEKKVENDTGEVKETEKNTEEIIEKEEKATDGIKAEAESKSRGKEENTGAEKQADALGIKDEFEKNAEALRIASSSVLTNKIEENVLAKGEAEGLKDTMDILATVPEGSCSDFTVIIPEEIYAGTLDTASDTELYYSVEAEMEDDDEGYLKISASRDGKLFHEEDESFAIPFHNRFGTKKLRKTGLDSRAVVDSSLFIRRQDVKKAKPGEYIGTIVFEIEYFSDKSISKEGGNKGGSSGSKKPRKPDTESNTGKPEKKEQKGDKIDEKGKYYADLSLRRNDDFDEKSMCDPLFFEKADLEVGNDNTKLIMYIIDPIPSYPEYGTPLKNVRFIYGGKSYKAKVGGKKIIKHFAQADGFIDAEGDYETSTVTVTLPNAAIKDSVNGELQCEAYVNAVMKSTQKFRVVLDGIEKGRSEVKKSSSIVLEDKEYISDLTLAEGKNKKKKSSLNALFSHKADILPDGETATLTMYFIDPVPVFLEEGTAFSEACFLYEKNEYAASVDSSDTSIIRKYQKTEGKIPAAGDYKSGKIQVELPVESINDSKAGKLRMRLFVKAGYEKEMTVTVILENLKGGSTKNSARTAGNTASDTGKKDNAGLAQLNTAKADSSARGAVLSAARKAPLKKAVKQKTPVTAAGALNAAGENSLLNAMRDETALAEYTISDETEQAVPGRSKILDASGLKSGRDLFKSVISFSLLIISSGVGYGIKRKLM